MANREAECRRGGVGGVEQGGKDVGEGWLGVEGEAAREEEVVLE